MLLMRFDGFRKILKDMEEILTELSCVCIDSQMIPMINEGGHSAGAHLVSLLTLQDPQSNEFVVNKSDDKGVFTICVFLKNTRLCDTATFNQRMGRYNLLKYFVTV
jgi:hypothetical protein